MTWNRIYSLVSKFFSECELVGCQEIKDYKNDETEPSEMRFKNGGFSPILFHKDKGSIPRM